MDVWSCICLNEKQGCSCLLNFKKCCCLGSLTQIYTFYAGNSQPFGHFKVFYCLWHPNCVSDSCVAEGAASNNANHAFSWSLVASMRYVIPCYLYIRKIDFQYNSEWLELCYKTSVTACPTLWEYFLVQTSEWMRRAERRGQSRAYLFIVPWEATI